MKIAIAGTGAIGAKFGWHLKKANNDVILIDGWDKNIEAIRKNGVVAKSSQGEESQKMPIYGLNEINKIKGYVDLVIVFTKSMQLENMLQTIKPIIGRDTYALCLLNGLGHETVLEKYINRNHIIMGVTMWASNMIAPGEILFEGNGNIELQSLDESTKKEALKIVQVLDDAKLNASYSENVMYSIWRKACVNGVMNTMCALLETNNVGFGATKTADFITRKIIAEFADVAQYEGINLDRSEVINHVENTWTVAHYPSMYQDLIKNSRLTEVDFINGAVWKKGKRYDVPTPYCAFITELIHAKEQILGI